VQQLVVDMRSHKIRAIDNLANENPVSFDQPEKGQVVPRFGAISMLRFAAGARQWGYLVSGVGLRDSHGDNVTIEDEDPIREALVEALRHGEADVAQELLMKDRGPFYLGSVSLIGPLDQDINVGELGTLDSQDDEVVENLIAPAWSTLRLN